MQRQSNTFKYLSLLAGGTIRLNNNGKLKLELLPVVQGSALLLGLPLEDSSCHEWLYTVYINCSIYVDLEFAVISCIFLIVSIRALFAKRPKLAAANYAWVVSLETVQPKPDGLKMFTDEISLRRCAPKKFLCNLTGYVRHLRLERPRQRPRLREGLRLVVLVQHPQVPAEHAAHDDHEHGKTTYP